MSRSSAAAADNAGIGNADSSAGRTSASITAWTHQRRSALSRARMPLRIARVSADRRPLSTLPSVAAAGGSAARRGGEGADQRAVRTVGGSQGLQQVLVLCGDDQA